MEHTNWTLAQVREHYEVIVEKTTGNAVAWSATVHLASHTGVESAAGFTVEISVSGDTGEVKFTATPAHWGNALPRLIPALLEAIAEYEQRPRLTAEDPKL